MPVPAFSGAPSWSTFEELRKQFNTNVEDLNFFFANLDTLNIKHLNAGVIDAGTLNADLVTIRSDLSAGAFVQIDGNGLTINNGSFNTFTTSINGQVTMTSALIQSSPSTYPRVVMDPANALFSAETSATTYARLEADHLLSNVPALVFNSPTLEASLSIQPLLGFSIISGGTMSIGSSGDLLIDGNRLVLNNSSQVTVSNWSQLFNTATSRTLQQDLDAKATVGNSTSTVGSYTRNGGIPLSAKVALSDDGTTITGTASWAGILIDAHNHAQT